MRIQSVFDAEFLRYGFLLKGYDFSELLQTLKRKTEKPENHTVYVPSSAELEALPALKELSEKAYGEMPIQIGYCNGSNQMLNCLEYHRGSEVNITADDIVLLLAPLQQLKSGSIDTSEIEAFSVPAGQGILLYETTLHYAPCNAPGGKGFQVAIVLPKGTNLELSQSRSRTEQDRFLWARNKWLVAHSDSEEASQGAAVGLTGTNLKVD